MLLVSECFLAHRGDAPRHALQIRDDGGHVALVTRQRHDTHTTTGYAKHTTCWCIRHSTSPQQPAAAAVLTMGGNVQFDSCVNMCERSLVILGSLCVCVFNAFKEEIYFSIFSGHRRRCRSSLFVVLTRGNWEGGYRIFGNAQYTHPHAKFKINMLMWLCSSVPAPDRRGARVMYTH